MKPKTKINWWWQVIFWIILSLIILVIWSWYDEYKYNDCVDDCDSEKQECIYDYESDIAFYGEGLWDYEECLDEFDWCVSDCRD